MCISKTPHFWPSNKAVAGCYKVEMQSGRHKELNDSFAIGLSTERQAIRRANEKPFAKGSCTHLYKAEIVGVGKTIGPVNSLSV